MNRITQTSGTVEALLQGAHNQNPVEALLLDRGHLIRVLRNTLQELHDERRRQEGTARHAEVVQRIRYFDAILGWVQGQPAELVVIGRRPSTSPQ